MLRSLSLRNIKGYGRCPWCRGKVHLLCTRKAYTRLQHYINPVNNETTTQFTHLSHLLSCKLFYKFPCSSSCSIRVVHRHWWDVHPTFTVSFLCALRKRYGGLGRWGGMARAPSLNLLRQRQPSDNQCNKENGCCCCDLGKAKEPCGGGTAVVTAAQHTMVASAILKHPTHTCGVLGSALPIRSHCACM